MTTGAWIMLLLTWSTVASVAIYLVIRVLATPPRGDD